MANQINRRTFIKQTAATGASLALLPVQSVRGEETASKEAKKSRIVEVSAPGVMIDQKKPDGLRVDRMVDQGMLALTGKDDLAEAWRCFIKPDDVVGIKVNAAGGHVMVTHRNILERVIEGVHLAGVPKDRIILWEQVEEYLNRYYLKDQKIEPEELGIRIEGCTEKLGKEHYMEGKPLPGFETDPVKFDWGEVKVAELVANKLTAIINLPILKDHRCSGVTLSLKNISHAVVNIPWHCHENSCDPYIADIVNIPSVRDKLRLHILDGLMGMADGGPSFRSFDHLFVQEKLLISEDPVAIDKIGHDWIAGVRKERDLPPLEEAENAIPGNKGRPATHIATAAARGLGTDDPAKMEIVKVDIPANAPEKETEPSEG